MKCKQCELTMAFIGHKCYKHIYDPYRKMAKRISRKKWWDAWNKDGMAGHLSKRGLIPFSCDPKEKEIEIEYKRLKIN